MTLEAVARGEHVESPRIHRVRDGGEFVLRPAFLEEDWAFVFDSWCNRVRPEPFGHIGKDAWQHHRRTVLEPLVERVGVQIAHGPGDPETYVGWVCAETQNGHQVLHFAFVKKPLRCFGAGTAMIASVLPELGKRETLTTYWTPKHHNWRHYATKWKLRYCPQLVGFDDERQEVPNE